MISPWLCSHTVAPGRRSRVRLSQAAAHHSANSRPVAVSVVDHSHACTAPAGRRVHSRLGQDGVYASCAPVDTRSSISATSCAATTGSVEYVTELTCESEAYAGVLACPGDAKAAGRWMCSGWVWACSLRRGAYLGLYS